MFIARPESIAATRSRIDAESSTRKTFNGVLLGAMVLLWHNMAGTDIGGH